MTIARYQNEYFGGNPFSIEGPFVLGSGLPAPNYTLGTIVTGDAGAEWVYCKLVLAAQTTLSPGMFMSWDFNYSASLLTTAAAVIGQEAGVFVGSSMSPTQAGGPNGTVTLAIGTYYIWVQRAGKAPAFVSAATVPNVANSIMETTAVAGQGNVPASATATTKQIAPVAFSAASTTFTANTVNASNTLTNLVGANTGSGPFIGATLNGTGVAGLTVIGLNYSPSGTVTSIIMSGNASATNAAVTLTVTGVLECSLQWPTIVKTN